MKMFRLFLAMAVMFVTVQVFAAPKKATKTVVYKADLHCENCKAKVEKNIPYEKGVKALEVDMENKTITVTFLENKNSVEGIQKAIEKLSISVSDVQEKEATKKCCEKKECEKEKTGNCCKDKQK